MISLNAIRAGRLPHILALASIAVAGATVPAAAAPAPPIFVNGEQTTVSAIERGGRVFVPIRGVFEKLDTAVTYTPPVSVVARKGATDVVRLDVGSRDATVHGRPAQLEAPAFRSGSHVFVPLRLISESAGAGVAYASAPRSIRITSERTVAAAAAAAPAAVAPAATAAPVAAERQGIPWWVWLLLALLFLLALLLLLRRPKPDPIITTSGAPRVPRDRP